MTSRDKKTSWGFDKRETGKKTYLSLEHLDDKKITVVVMACLKEKNIDETYKEKLRKHQQFAFEFIERGPGLRTEIVPIVIGCIGGGMK